MKKNMLYRLIGLGAMPKGIHRSLEKERITVFDEGMSGWFITKNVKGPGRRYIHRREGFLGSLAVTRKRVICFTYSKRQINIPIEDPKISELKIHLPDRNSLSLSFDSALFREGWEGIIEYRFKTEKASQFFGALKSVGATPI